MSKNIYGKVVFSTRITLDPGIRLIGLSGKKQSGKNTICNDIKNFIEEMSGPEKVVKIYSFADALKETVCMGMLNLTHEQCFGTDEDKNTLTEYCWDNLPSEICKKYGHNGTPREGYYEDYMTAREVMQVVGTDIFRKFFSSYVHINATMNRINKDKPYMALISDVRFQTEIMAICASGGYNIRLTRNSNSTDSHESETALDHLSEKDWDDHNGIIIDNKNLSIEEQSSLAISYVQRLEYYFEIYPEKKE
jgi:hypothetical protein